MTDQRPLDEVLDDIRFILNQVAMRERLSCELSDDELHLIAIHGEDAVMDQQDQLNAHAQQLGLLTTSAYNLSRIEKERNAIQRQALRVIELYTALFSCLSERGARNILNT
jgi:arginine exporter protein ArgO